MSEAEATEVESADESDGDELNGDEPTIVRESTDNVGDVSVEINVEDLLQELEVDGILSAENGYDAARHRLEEIMEQKKAAEELEDFEDYDV